MKVTDGVVRRRRTAPTTCRGEADAPCATASRRRAPWSPAPRCAAPPADGPAPEEDPDGTPPRRRRRLPGALALCLALALGSGLLVTAYNVATSSPDQVAARYALFWSGLLVGVVPLLAVLLAGAGGAAPRRRHTRLVLLALGLYTALPKLLRAPHDPVLYDEQLHVSQAEAIMRAGSLFGVSNSVVPAVEHYPLLHGVLVVGHWASGASLYHVGLAVVAVAHVAALFAVAALARAMGAEERVAALAGGLYALGPGFMFFATMVAYQSLALPLGMWTLVAALTVVRQRGAWSRSRALRLALALAGAAAVAITHHLTTLMLVAALSVLAAARALHSGRSRAAWGELAVLVLLAGAALLIQLASVGEQLGSVGRYLFPGVDAIAPSLLASEAAPAASEAAQPAARGAFSGSVLPLYERLAGFLAPAIVLTLGAAGVLLRRRAVIAGWARLAGLLTLLAYLATFPLIFSARGATMAHRAWPFLMVLLAPLLAVGVLELRGWLSDGSPLLGSGVRGDAAGRAWRRPLAAARSLRLRLPPVVGTRTVLVVLAVLLVGNTATEVNDSVRFPGHHEVGADGRATDAHTLAAAAWLRRVHGPGARVAADTSTGMSLVALAGASKVRGYPTWELVRDPSRVGVPQLARTASRGLEYLVLDTRIATRSSARGYYFEDYEPKAYSGVPLTSPQALRELAEMPWARQVFASGPVVVYRLRPYAVGVTRADVRRERRRVPQRLLDLDASAS